MMYSSRPCCIRLLSLLALCLCLAWGDLYAAPLSLTGELGKIPLSSHFELLEDKTGKLEIGDILKPEYARRFRHLPGNLSASYTKSVFWLRLDLRRSRTDASQQWLMEITPVMLDDIRLYYPKADGSIEIHRAGDHLPFSALEIHHHYPVFLLNLPSTDPHVVYLRIQSTSSVFLRATLWAPQTFVEESNFISNMMGVYYGIMLAMIFYNLVLAISYRSKSIAYYLLLSSTTLTGGMSLNGHIGMYFAPDWPALVDLIPGLIVPLILLSVSLFIATFLQLRERLPRVNWFFTAVQVFAACAAIIVLAGFNPLIAPVVQAVAMLQMLVILPVCLYIGLSGYRPGYIVMLASAIWIVGATMVTLRNLGIIESSWASDYGFQIGSAIEVILLALAQADHINLIRKEHQQSQARLLEISQRSEQELDAQVKQRTTELAAAISHLQKLDKDKNDFLGIAAHDLKNPLASIIGMSDLLRKLYQTMSVDQHLHYLERISHSGQRMMRIISNLLDINVMDTGNLQMHVKALDLGKILQEVAQQYEEMLRLKHLQLSLDIQGRVMVNTDPDACVQIMDNLLSNAIKYSPQGKRIWLSVSSNAGFGVVQVRDEGPGLSPVDQQHLFEKFSRLSSLPTAGEASTGLGLFIVKKLCEACGGKVRCESDVGQGCTFIVELPLCDDNRPLTN